MSRRIPEDEYGKRPMGAFRQWMEGSRDPYAGNVEVRAHDMPVESEEQLKKYQEEVFTVLRKAQDTANNNQYTLFRKFYRVAALLCCLTLTLLLFITVAYLPPVGNAGNPANNEVAAKYIEDGMQDTGVVNIVTGMILDYRAFDTFGESNVLFIATCTVLILMRNDKKKGRGSAEEEERRDSFHEPKNQDAESVHFLFALADTHRYHISHPDMHQYSSHRHYETDKNQNTPHCTFSTVLQK